MLELLLRVTLDPAVASHVAAVLVGEPELGTELRNTCWREGPRCIIRGEHKGDASQSLGVWRKAVRRGDYDPQTCSYHRYVDEHGRARNFSTRTSWGAMHGFTWPHFAAATGIRCAPVWLLDVPILGAIAVALRMQAACANYGACNERDRRLLWSGLGVWLNRGTPLRRPYGGVFALEWG